MGIELNTRQVGHELMQQLATVDGAPNITSTKVRALVAAGLFTDTGNGGRSIRIDIDEIHHLTARTRYVADPAEIADLILRVSVIERRTSTVFDELTGQQLRTHAGVDYSDPNQMGAVALGGFEGVWHVGIPVADRLVDEAGLLLATCKGYVHPDHVRTVTDWRPVQGTSRRYLRTRPAPTPVVQVVGTGIWIDVPAGRESGILVG